MSKATTMTVKPASSKPATKIPQSALKAVSSLREIVENTEEEIYAALKECHMDLNEAVQKLISQDPWEVPQRRKGKNKKESHGGQSSGDSRVRSVPGAGSRGNRGGPADRGSGRGGPSKFSSTDLAGARGKPLPPRENGIHPSSRPMGNAPPQSQSAPYIQPKSYGQSLSPTATTATGAVPASLSPSLPNGGQVYAHAPTSSTSARPRGSWGPSGGGISMADIVKANGAPAGAPAPSSATSAAASAVPTPPAVQTAQSSSPSQYLSPSDSVSVPQTATTGVYASATDPVLHHPLEPRGVAGAPLKRDLGTVGGQRPIGDRPTSASSAGPSPSGNAAPPSSSQAAGPAHPLGPPTTQVPASSSGLEWKPKAPSSQSQSQPAAVASSTTTSSSAVTMVDTGLPSSSSVASKMQGLNLQEENTNKPVMIPSHLQVSDSERPHLSFGSFEAATFSSFGSGFGTAVEEAPAPASSKGEAPSTADTKLEAASTRQQSMGTTAAAPSATQGYSTSASMSGNAAPAASAAEVSSMSQNMTGAATLHLEQATSKADSSIMQQGPPYPYVPTLQSYPYGLVQQIPAGGQYGAPYEPTDVVSQQQEVSSRLPGLGGMQQQQLYSDPTGSYYSPGFRPQPDSEASSRYSPAGVSNVMASAASVGGGNSKYGGGVAATSQPGMGGETGVSLSSSSLSAAGLSAAQTAATAAMTQNNSHTPSSQQTSNVSAGGLSAMPTIPQQQQPLPLHGYATQPAGIPIGPYHTGMYSGFAQYMPSTYTYHMHAPYGTHPTTYGVTPQNSAYPQAPAGTAYHPAAAGSSYPPGGGAANVKYPLPQYKPGAGGAAGGHGHNHGAPHHTSTMASAGGSYAAAGGYAGAPSAGGYVGAPSGAGGAGMGGSGYEDVVGASQQQQQQQYKDSNLYIASQQMTRDMAAGMPTSSYYNMAGQGQHAGYGHTQQPTHAHAAAAAAAYAAAGMFHPSQAGPGPTGHQMLQQPQPMGGGASGGGVAQGGGYQQQQQQQQQQRGQQSWNNGY